MWKKLWAQKSLFGTWSTVRRLRVKVSMRHIFHGFGSCGSSGLLDLVEFLFILVTINNIQGQTDTLAFCFPFDFNSTCIVSMETIISLQLGQN
jgi:hypothetical protein